MKKILFLSLLLITSLVSSQSQINVISGGTPSFCAEYQVVYDAYTTKPVDSIATFDNRMVKRLVDSGLWARIDAFYFFAIHTNTAGEALINWKLPGTYNATNYNAPTFTALQGILYNGTTQYTDHNFNPSVNGVNYTQNSASQILYIRTNLNTTGYHGIDLSSDTKQTYIVPRQIGYTSCKMNGNSAKSAAVGTGNGLYVNTCVDVTNLTLYKNAIPVATGSRDAKGAPTHKFFTGAYNDDDVAAGFRADQVSNVAFANGFTQTDVTNYTLIIEENMDAKGTGVIP